MIRMCIKDRVSSHSSYNLLFSDKIQLHFVLVLWRVIGHPYIESATALSDCISSRNNICWLNLVPVDNSKVCVCRPTSSVGALSHLVPSIVLRGDL